ncbi:MAG TPA: GAF domain-containing SpoIIE family protein phosphatase [Solirubrobacteraceae bacterium]|nr:GAF domain-containing SpoIIE family protein phosphatase [Solirubrobacteraceae bacterium]
MTLDDPEPEQPIHSLPDLVERLGTGGIGLGEILDSLGEAVTIRNPQHQIIYANRRAVEHMHFDSLDELVRAGPTSIMSDYIVQDERGRELSMQDIPSVRQLAGAPAQPLLIRTVHRGSGAVSWNLLKATVLRDQTDEPIASVMIIEDVTVEKTAELRERFLARATETLMSSLDYQETLRNVAWLAVPELADWCAVDLVDEAGSRQQVVAAHRDPEKLALAEKLRGYEPDPPDPEQGIGRVIRTGASELYPDITDEMLRLGAQDDEHLRLLRAVGFRSAVIVPLRARGRTLGVLTLVSAESMRRFEESDREFAQQVADRAAIAVDNARLATARRDIAITLQRSLLPDAVPAIPGWEIATMYRAASASDEVEVGGDFYDFFPTPSGWIVLLGDVTGRGVEAAAMTSLVRHGARFLAKQEYEPSAILAHLDEALREQPGLSLCSALCVRLQEGGMLMSSAGHPAPLVARDDGRIREIGGSGPILGGWENSSWEDREIRIGPDETLLMYTDGVTDTRGATERFGIARLRRLLTELAGSSPRELLSSLQVALDAFQTEGHADDTGAVALRPYDLRVPASSVPAATAELVPSELR